MTDADTTRGPDDRGPGPLRTAWLEMLLDVSRRINAEVNPDAVLAAIVDSLVLVTRGRPRLPHAARRGRRAGVPRSPATARAGRSRSRSSSSARASSRRSPPAARRGSSTTPPPPTPGKSRLSVISLRLRTILCVPLKTPARRRRRDLRRQQRDHARLHRSRTCRSSRRSPRRPPPRVERLHLQRGASWTATGCGGQLAHRRRDPAHLPPEPLPRASTA